MVAEAHRAELSHFLTCIMMMALLLFYESNLIYPGVEEEKIFFPALISGVLEHVFLLHAQRARCFYFLPDTSIAVYLSLHQAML